MTLASSWVLDHLLMDRPGIAMRPNTGISVQM
jgi:hypothetical protein